MSKNTDLSEEFLVVTDDEAFDTAAKRIIDNTLDVIKIPSNLTDIPTLEGVVTSIGLNSRRPMNVSDDGQYITISAGKAPRFD